MPSLTTILATCRALFERLAPTRDAWHIEVHQFRIEARSGVEGRPTPEGMHRDGVDYVLVLLIGRRNIQSGVTTIHDASGRDLGSFTLAEPFDAAWVDDHRVMHGVTPVEPIDPEPTGVPRCAGGDVPADGWCVTGRTRSKFTADAPQRAEQARSAEKQPVIPNAVSGELPCCCHPVVAATGPIRVRKSAARSVILPLPLREGVRGRGRPIARRCGQVGTPFAFVPRSPSPNPRAIG